MPRTALVRTSPQAVEGKTPARKPAKELPSYPGSTRPVQDSEWRVYVRDHDIDVTFNEWALATLYGTYGHWGQKAYPSDNWIAKKFHIKRDTVANARKSLLSKGLIRCIGTVPGQPNQFAYCLTLPVEVEDGRVATLYDTGVGPISGNGWSPNGQRVVPQTGNGWSPNGHQEIEEQEKEIETSSVDGGDEVGPSGDNRGGDPHTPQDPGVASSVPVSPAFDAVPGDSPADGGAVDGNWVGDGDTARESRAWLAGLLGVDRVTVHASLWPWLESLGLDYDSVDHQAVLDAADASVGAQKPPAYFRKILPSFVAEARAKHDAEAQDRDAEAQDRDAEADAQRQAEEAALRREQERELLRQREATAREEIEVLLREYVTFVPEYDIDYARRLLQYEGRTDQARLEALRGMVQRFRDQAQAA